MFDIGPSRLVAAAIILAAASCSDAGVGNPTGPDATGVADVDNALDGGAKTPRDAAPTDGGAVPLRDAEPEHDAEAADAGQNLLPTFVGSWGGRGTADGQFIEPSSVELDSTGVVIVAGHENRVQRFTHDGRLISIFGERGTADGQFNHPHGLAVDRRRGDLIYVGDQENGRLQVFDTEGRFLRQWGDSGFQHIHDVGIDPESGDVFVGDLERNTLRKFSSEGALLLEVGGPGDGPGRFNGVWGVSTDSVGNVFVADTNNRRIQKLDRNGAYLSAWGGFDGQDFVKPTGVYVDHEDAIYVCDALAQTVFVFDSEGAPLQRWDLAQIVGFRTEPEDIVIDANGEHVYIAEVFGHLVLHLRLGGD